MHTCHTLIFRLFVQCILCILWSSNYLFSVYLAYFNIQVIFSVHTWHTLIFKLFVRCKLCTLRRAHCAIQLALHFVWLISCHKGQLQCRFFKTCVTLPLGGWVLQRQCALWIGVLYFCTWWAVALWALQTASQKGATVLLPYLGSWPPIASGGDHMMSCCIAPSLQTMEKLWWTLTKLFFKPIAIGKFCLGSILSKLG